MPLVAMTREMGSLGKDVAARLAERAGRKVIYHEIIDQLANKMRLRKSHVERFLEGKSGLWERLTTDRTSLSIFTADETFRILREGGAAVIRGWGAVHLLGGIPHVIRVRVCAPLDLRIERMMQRLATDDREAVRSEILVSEEAHGAITRRHFGINWRDPEHYDVVLSTERLSVDECVEEVESVMRRPRFQESEDSIRVFDDLALEWAVRSALRHDPRTQGLGITVVARDGRITLQGVADREPQAEAAREVAAAVEGVSEVANELKSASGGSRYRREG
jgi:cytidylate kinase